MGNMRINNLSVKETEGLIYTALEAGINVFDHADIYGGGSCEEHFSKALSGNESIREKIILQSKCGIRKGYYDFSKEHILSSVDGILQRLDTDYLDILLLHRPDPLMEPDEVAEAFDQLHHSGKVRYFGVSNHNPTQIELLQKSLTQKLVVNQMQLSIAHTPLIDSGVSLNMNTDNAVNRDSSTLEYCRLNDITLQAWSPFQTGFFDGVFVGDNERFPELNKVLERLAKKYDVTPTSIAVAWITRHPANIQVVLGTTNAARLQESAAGSEIPLTRQEWFELYAAAGNMVP
ncbi:aldo/keto reductase family oxidoreductase [Alkalicoccobacillus porphyridii]|uniref:Aldo/keto reductase family oxidoreductase n=1 Tax=Alkalicoccobacillus porphyridii TaxID=2597270 RepID=A0A554A1L4_9BACI|nr:aldo/keto reductase [Alkalicoccobacillus porphyridii]TSB47565.1 aldo/keto reductase family oxidoreductase [Alkalicoccobacillus porphyridii]